MRVHNVLDVFVLKWRINNEPGWQFTVFNNGLQPGIGVGQIPQMVMSIDIFFSCGPPTDDLLNSPVASLVSDCVSV